jgi:hypothetical protein
VAVEAGAATQLARLALAGLTCLWLVANTYELFTFSVVFAPCWYADYLIASILVEGPLLYLLLRKDVASWCRPEASPGA